MTSVPDKIRSNIISHTVDVHRYEAGLRKKILRMIDQLGQDLVSQLVNSGLDTPRTAWQRSRLTALLKEAESTVGKAYGDITATVSDELQGLIEITGNAIVTACNDAFGANLMVPVKWTPELLAKLADETLIQGAPSAEWWARQGDGLSQAFADQMRQGMLRGETVTQLRDRIMGQNIPGVNAAGKIDLRTVQPQLRAPIFTARRNAEALVRTSVISTANAAHMAAFEANADIMDGVQWVSTLDQRTCTSCASMDLRTWAWGETHPVPSLHWGCRCSITSITKSWSQLAQEANGNSRLARELDKMTPGNRASMGGPVSGNLKYEDWFDQQSEARQLEILGPKRFSLYKKGDLGFADMIGQNGNPLTLKELSNVANPIAKSARIDYSNIKNMPTEIEGFPIKMVGSSSKRMGSYEYNNNNPMGTIVINTGKSVSNYWGDVAGEQQRMFESGWMSSPDPNHVVWHELGHAKSISKMPLADRKYANTIKSKTFRDVAGRVSQYAKSDGLEFIAETFAALRSGITFDDEVMALYRSLLNGVEL